MTLMIAASVLFGVAAPGPVGPEGLRPLKQGQTLSHFTVHALYRNASDEPMGARFIHANGMPVDVLFFASVPQVSVYARTLPVSEKGESHTGEHLLIGKGLVGKKVGDVAEIQVPIGTLRYKILEISVP